MSDLAHTGRAYSAESILSFRIFIFGKIILDEKPSVIENCLSNEQYLNFVVQSLKRHLAKALIRFIFPICIDKNVQRNKPANASDVPRLQHRNAL